MFDSFIGFCRSNVVVSRVIKDCFKSNYLNDIGGRNDYMPSDNDINFRDKVSENLFKTMIYSNNPYHPKYQYLNKKLWQNLKKQYRSSNKLGIYKSEYHVYAININKTKSLYKLLVVDSKLGKKVIDLKKETFTANVKFIKKNGRPFCFYEEELKKLYYIKYRRWYYLDEDINTKNSYFGYDNKTKDFFTLRCQLDEDYIIYKYNYFKTNHKRSMILPDKEREYRKTHD